MFLTGILSWWYTGGLIERFDLIKNRLIKSYDFFSIDLLIKTLFAPFRQISAGRVEGSLDIVIRAFFDRLLSRIIGATVRTFMILFGTVTLIIQFLIGTIIVVFWLFIPIFPAVGLIMMLIGWTI